MTRVSEAPLASAVFTGVETAEFSVPTLGPCRVPTTYRPGRYVSDEARTLYHTTLTSMIDVARFTDLDVAPSFELAGPRRLIYFDPSKTRVGIVTCGGLCPGLNDVIRAIVLQLYYYYRVKDVVGFQYGFEGLVPAFAHEVIPLTPASVTDIGKHGGTVLASSRGPQPTDQMVEALERMNIQILFVLGGDGTFRGALALHEEIQKRRLKTAVVAIPKTIDNDIPYTERTFGFETAYTVAADVIRSAHVESRGAFNGIGLVKLMGRYAGFIAAHATLASREVNFVLVPEASFELEGDKGLFALVEDRLKARQHAVIVVAEGAGQQLFSDAPPLPNDASGNKRLHDLGPFLRDRLSEYLSGKQVRHVIKYIDPSYLVRSAPATASDSLFAGILGQMAVHAAMAGKTAMFIGHWNAQFTHVPISAAVSGTKRLDPLGTVWQSAVECTGQPLVIGRGAAAPK